MGHGFANSDVTINVHINRLRKRCEGFTEFEIAAIRGIGYKHASSGNGLGLTIAKKIVELHGGSICVSSKEGEGAKFTVVLCK